MQGMIDAKALLDRFLGAGLSGQQGQRPSGSPSGTSPWGAPPPAGNTSGGGLAGGLAQAAQQILGRGGASGGSGLGSSGLGGSGLGGSLGGLAGLTAAGGLLGTMLGKKSGKRGGGGGLLSHGGAAVLGALAHRAWQNWQAGQAPQAAPTVTARDVEAVEPRFLPGAAPAAGGEAFELSLIRAMIGAARSDGHIDAEERARIFEQVEKAGLDAEAKAFVFDTLDAPIGVSEVAAAARTPEQAAEIYLVSCLAMDPDEPAERAYLAALAHRLKLPEGLAEHLGRQAEAAIRPAG
ncbi:tellurite resistance TerB family protein [Teichococcus aestuarii]|nr:DUF533 domain-containing protein [Pseudoroseomonas aestuarii]